MPCNYPNCLRNWYWIRRTVYDFWRVSIILRRLKMSRSLILLEACIEYINNNHRFYLSIAISYSISIVYSSNFFSFLAWFRSRNCWIFCFFYSKTCFRLIIAYERLSLTLLLISINWDRYSLDSGETTLLFRWMKSVWLLRVNKFLRCWKIGVRRY